MQTSVSKIKMWSLESLRALGNHEREEQRQVTKGMVTVLRHNTWRLAKSGMSLLTYSEGLPR